MAAASVHWRGVDDNGRLLWSSLTTSTSPLRAARSQVRALCEKAKEILMEESNVQFIGASSETSVATITNIATGVPMKTNHRLYLSW